MVYIKRWAEFQAQCIDLYRESPDKARYLIKATPSQTWLVLKVTDDQTCLKFKARSAIIINRFEAFTRDMTALMAGQSAPSLQSTSAAGTGSGVAAMELDTDANVLGKAVADGKGTAKGAGGGPAGAGGKAQQGTQNAASAGTAAGGAAGAGGGASKKKKKKGGKK